MNTHALLDQHPSVQALNIGTSANPAKAAVHTRTINARPFTTASAVMAAHKGGRKDAKGTRIVVERQEANIRAAAVAAAAAKSSGKFKVTPTTKLAEKRGLPQRPPSGGSAPRKPPSDAPAALPPVAAGAKGASRVDDDDDGRATVSSVASSFEPTSTHPGSYSDYSCSCCHPRRAASSVVTFSTGVANSKRSTAPSAFSSTSVPLSAYENMSSISERIAKQKRAEKKAAAVASRSGAPTSLTGSMTSSRLRDLEQELAVEREQRKHTEEELAEIRARQELLLSRLSDRDREDVRKLVVASRDAKSTASSKASGRKAA